MANTITNGCDDLKATTDSLPWDGRCIIPRKIVSTACLHLPLCLMRSNAADPACHRIQTSRLWSCRTWISQIYMIRKLKSTLLIVMLALSSYAGAQNAAVKTNLLADCLLNPNIGVEVGLAPKWTLEATGQFNAWTLSHERRWKHWAVQPEVRYWLCDRFSAHFFGVHLHGGEYNMGGIDGHVKFLGTDTRKLKDSRYQGWFVGAGVAYGYAWILGRHWNLEAEIGLGYSYTRYDRFRCTGCGKRVETDKPHHYVGPTKVAINLVYLF